MGSAVYILPPEAGKNLGMMYYDVCRMGEMVHEVKTQHFFSGYPWMFMDRQWKSMKVHGYPRKKCCVLASWTFMDVHEVPRISIDFHGPFRLGAFNFCPPENLCIEALPPPQMPALKFYNSRSASFPALP